MDNSHTWGYIQWTMHWLMIPVYTSRNSSLVVIVAYNWLYPVITGFVPPLYKAIHHDIVFSSHFPVPLYSSNINLRNLILLLGSWYKLGYSWSYGTATLNCVLLYFSHSNKTETEKQNAEDALCLQKKSKPKIINR